ncbi:MAG: 2OG-Fe(II) oxygenase [Acidobacteriota bacterium]|nr:2OG-Fe(II) oxygenase [Acidobacteriota bacterium]
MPQHSAPGLVVRHGFLDADTLQAIGRALDADPGEATEVRAATTRDWKVDAGVRRTWEASLPDEVEERILRRIEALRPELEAHFGVWLDPCEAVAALRYPTGAFYRAHRDVSDDPRDDEVHRRVVSIVVFVNEGERAHAAAYAGGRLCLYGPMSAQTQASGMEAPAEAGTLVAFPSAWLHEVTPVDRGERRTVVTWLMRAAAGS